MFLYGIKILILIFGLLFLLERKPMNILFNFIGLIISVALLLGLYNADYLAYLIIIIYCSALSIIFGFVIMLSPKIVENHESKALRYVFVLLAGFILIFLIQAQSPDSLYEISNVTNSMELIKSSSLINKIGDLLYLDFINIFKFFISALILLLALVALFYIVLPTF